MADLVSVPDSGDGSGASSTATFGQSLQTVFAMPAADQVETSVAGSDSGADVVYRPNVRTRRVTPREGSGSGTRSPNRVPVRNGSTQSSTTSRSPSARPTTLRSSRDDSQAGSRGRSSKRDTSGQASGSQVSKSPGDMQPSARPISKTPSPAQGSRDPHAGKGQVYTPTVLDTPQGSPSFAPTRVDSPITLPRVEVLACQSGAGPVPNGVPREHHGGSLPTAMTELVRGRDLQPMQLTPSRTNTRTEQKDYMDASQAGKRSLEPGSMSQPSTGRARTASPR